MRQRAAAAADKESGVFYKATCANVRAVERALADLDAGYGANEISLLVSATESHSQKNLNRTRAEQWQNIAEMVARRRRALPPGRHGVGGLRLPVRGQGRRGRRASPTSQRFLELGVRTSRSATPPAWRRRRACETMFSELGRRAPDSDRALPRHARHRAGELRRRLRGGRAPLRFFVRRRRRPSGEGEVRRRLHRQRLHRGPGEPVRVDGHRHRHRPRRPARHRRASASRRSAASSTAASRAAASIRCSLEASVHTQSMRLASGTRRW